MKQKGFTWTLVLIIFSALPWSESALIITSTKSILFRKQPLLNLPQQQLLCQQPKSQYNQLNQ